MCFTGSRNNPSFDEPAVTISIAKRKSRNAVTVAENILKRVERWKKDVLPSEVQITVTRNYGETAQEKSNELLFHMMIAVISVTLLIAFALGKRESIVVAVAIPVTLALTLTVFYLHGYTLNRITLFALIFSIGILVDDAIVVVENIVRHRDLPLNAGRPFAEVAAEAVDEVGNPDHPCDACGDCGDLADGVCGRTDGALHATNPRRRKRGHDFLPHRSLSLLLPGRPSAR